MYLRFELIVEVRVVELDKAEEQGSFLGNGVVPGYFLLHIVLQEGHVAQEATRKGSQQLEQQLDLRVVTPVEGTQRELMNTAHGCKTCPKASTVHRTTKTSN